MLGLRLGALIARDHQCGAADGLRIAGMASVRGVRSLVFSLREPLVNSNRGHREFEPVHRAGAFIEGRPWLAAVQSRDRSLLGSRAGIVSPPSPAEAGCMPSHEEPSAGQGSHWLSAHRPLLPMRTTGNRNARARRQNGDTPRRTSGRPDRGKLQNAAVINVWADPLAPDQPHSTPASPAGRGPQDADLSSICLMRPPGGAQDDPTRSHETTTNSSRSVFLPAIVWIPRLTVATNCRHGYAYKRMGDSPVTIGRRRVATAQKGGFRSHTR